MKRPSGLACFGLPALAFVLSACNAGTVTEAQQDAKVKAMNDIAKQDPHYAEKRAAHGER